MNIEATLTDADLAAPFRAAPVDSEPLRGPTRTALQIVEGRQGVLFVERDPATGRRLAVERRSKQKDVLC